MFIKGSERAVLQTNRRGIHVTTGGRQAVARHWLRTPCVRLRLWNGSNGRWLAAIAGRTAD